MAAEAIKLARRPENDKRDSFAVVCIAFKDAHLFPCSTPPPRTAPRPGTGNGAGAGLAFAPPRAHDARRSAPCCDGGAVLGGAVLRRRLLFRRSEVLPVPLPWERNCCPWDDMTWLWTALGGHLEGT